MKHILMDLDLPAENLAQLKKIPGCHFEIVPGPNWGKRRSFPSELVANAEILLCRYPPDNFADCKKLRFIQGVTVGFDHLNHMKLHQWDGRYCNARGIFDSAIGEWNISMMVNLVRDLPGMFRNQQAKVWSRDARFHQEIRSKTVGLWGYGGLGRETARLAKACGMQVHVLSRSGVGPRKLDYTPAGTGDPEGILPDRVFNYDQRHEFLRGLDFLIVAIPKTTKTIGLIGWEELTQLPNRAWLINVARGPIIQEAALIRLLRENRIMGAALDVHYAYPLPPEHPLWEMPNVILTPHISGSELSIYYHDRIADLFSQNLQRYLAGDKLLNEVSKADFAETCGE